MKALARRVVHSVPPLRRATKFSRRRMNELGTALTERSIQWLGNYEILVLLGMRRSGNHLAINWILQQTDGSSVFYNNIRHDTYPYAVGMREFRFRARGARPRIVLSYEDLTTDAIDGGPLPAFLAHRAQEHKAKVRFGLILRDPYNLFASRIRKWPQHFKSDRDISDQVNLWLAHVALAEEPRAVFGPDPVVPILYNKLVVDPCYRDSLAESLNSLKGDAGLDDVPVYGHGSSFDGYETQGKTVQAGVFERWKSSLDDPRFRRVIADKRLQEAAERVFGIAPPRLNDL